MSRTGTEVMTGCGVVLAVCIAISLVMGLIIMLLWNWVIVSLFRAPVIDYWMGVGLSLVLTVLRSVFSTRAAA